MSRINVRIMLAIVATTALASTAYAVTPLGCNNATVVGTYSVNGSGQHQKSDKSARIVPLKFSGMIAFNPNTGQYSLKAQLQMADGKMRELPMTTGTYQVDQACHINFQQTAQTKMPIWHGVVSNGGNSITGGFNEENHKTHSFMTRVGASY